jgi:hypothetical protein
MEVYKGTKAFGSIALSSIIGTSPIINSRGNLAIRSFVRETVKTPFDRTIGSLRDAAYRSGFGKLSKETL